MLAVKCDFCAVAVSGLCDGSDACDYWCDWCDWWCVCDLRGPLSSLCNGLVTGRCENPVQAWLPVGWAGVCCVVAGRLLGGVFRIG